MKNIVFRIQFDGRDFYGYQIQNDERTVQGEIQRAIKEVLKEDITINGCSRTDSGVSAENYYLNFKSNTSIPENRLMYPVNNILPDSIRILESFSAADDFHARYSAHSKSYIYRFYTGDVELPLEHHASYVKHNLDFDRMQKAAEMIKGVHDFKAFMSSGSSVSSTIREIYEIELTKNNNNYCLRVRGNGFLYNMVRIIAGTLVYVGAGVLTLKDVEMALESGERKYAGKVMPAKGLILENVYY